MHAVQEMMDETVIQRVRAARACGVPLAEIVATMRYVRPELVWLAWHAARILDA